MDFFFVWLFFVVYNHSFWCRIGGQCLNDKPDVPNLMCASSFPWPLFYSSRFSLSKEELLHVPLSYLPSGHTSFFSFVLWIVKAFCSHPALTFILAVTSSCLTHLPWSFFLSPFQYQQQKVVIYFHSVKSLKKFYFFSLAPVLPEYLLFGVFFLFIFILCFNTLNYLNQQQQNGMLPQPTWKH